tara:strand:+ start:843 stop:1238 length:396 start_codon:yes stop_codon:yes gene_type:complete
MATTYSYTLKTCFRDQSDIITAIVADWTAQKTVDAVTYESKYTQVVQLDAAGSSPISYGTLDEATLKTWYENKLSTKKTVTDVSGNSTPDTRTIEEETKQALDANIEGQIYDKGVQDNTFIPKSGLPFGSS